MKKLIFILIFLYPVIAGAQQGRNKSFPLDNVWMNVGNAGFSEGNAYSTCLAIGPADGQPYIAFSDEGYSGKARLMKFDGTRWLNVGTRGFSAVGTAYTSLAFSPVDSLPYVAFQDAAFYYDPATVMKFDGTNWVYIGSEGFSPNSADYVCIAFNPEGQPYVAFRDFSHGTSVMKLNGTNWVLVGPRQFSAGDAEYVSLAINPSDYQPYIAYEDKANSCKATVMKFNGFSWVNVGLAGFTADSVWFTNISFNPVDGLPYVAFADYNSPNKAEVMKFDGTNWVNIGNSGASPGPVQWVSLAFSPTGKPCVAYADWEDPDNRATVREFDGTNWINVGNADFSSGQVLYASLAIRQSDSQPYLAYQDGGNSGKATVMHYNSPVGTGELQKSRQIIYPNPSSIEITIETSAIPTQSHLSISNLAGQQLITRQLTEQKTQLDVSNLPSGVYFVRLTSEKAVAVGKLIKN